MNRRRRLIRPVPARPYTAGTTRTEATHVVPPGTWVTLWQCLPEGHWEAITVDTEFIVIITEGDLA